MEAKTNAMRRLDAARADYTPHSLGTDQPVTAVEAAQLLGADPARVFKTLVTQGKSGAYYVFIIPAAAELDLKKAAAAAGEKSVSMIAQKLLLPLTGYVHGGCSPIGMKKQFPTFIDDTARDYGTIFFSAGRLGCQIETSLKNLSAVVDVTVTSLTV